MSGAGTNSWGRVALIAVENLPLRGRGATAERGRYAGRLLTMSAPVAFDNSYAAAAVLFTADPVAGGRTGPIRVNTAPAELLGSTQVTSPECVNGGGRRQRYLGGAHCHGLCRHRSVATTPVGDRRLSCFGEVLGQ